MQAETWPRDNAISRRTHLRTLMRAKGERLVDRFNGGGEGY